MSLLSALLTVVLPIASTPSPTSCRGPLGRAAVVACALAEHPSIRAAEAGREAARSRKLSARTLLPSNPQVEVTAARRVGMWTGDRDINVYGRVTQELEIAGQRRRRMEVADAEVTQAERQIELSRREVAAAALAAYYEWIAAREQQQMIGRIARAAGALVALARTSERTGLASGLYADVVMAASVRVLRQQIEAERRIAAARAVLAGLLGRDGAGLEITGDLTPLAVSEDPSRLIGTALMRRAEIELAQAEREMFVRRVELFRRLRAPNPSVVLYAQRDGFAEQVLGGGLVFPLVLPAPLGRTYKGEIAESRALARRAEAEIERWRRVVQTEVEVASREVEARKAELELFQPDRLQRAESDLEALAQEIASGRVSLRDAVVLQQTLLEYLAAHIEARRALAIGSVELARVAGLLPEDAGR